MGNKIEVGEYIRTEDGFIGKVKRIETELEKIDGINIWYKWYVFDKNIGEIHINESYIKEHSFNIIDLIEEGDFIKIKDEYLKDKCLTLDTESWLNKVKREILNNYWKLVSIVTKEQFKAIEFEV